VGAGARPRTRPTPATALLKSDSLPRPEGLANENLTGNRAGRHELDHPRGEGADETMP